MKKYKRKRQEKLIKKDLKFRKKMSKFCYEKIKLEKFLGHEIRIIKRCLLCSQDEYGGRGIFRKFVVFEKTYYICEDCVDNSEETQHL